MTGSAPATASPNALDRLWLLLPRGDSARAAWARYGLGILALLIVLIALKDNEYYLTLLIITYIYAGLATAWNIIGGFGGQFTLGHGVFFAAGAYLMAILYTRYHISPC